MTCQFCIDATSIPSYTPLSPFFLPHQLTPTTPWDLLKAFSQTGRICNLRASWAPPIARFNNPSCLGGLHVRASSGLEAIAHSCVSAGLGFIGRMVESLGPLYKTNIPKPAGIVRARRRHLLHAHNVQWLGIALSCRDVYTMVCCLIAFYDSTANTSFDSCCGQLGLVSWLQAMKDCLSVMSECSSMGRAHGLPGQELCS